MSPPNKLYFNRKKSFKSKLHFLIDVLLHLVGHSHTKHIEISLQKPISNDKTNNNDLTLTVLLSASSASITT